MSGYHVAIVGATGLVGRTILQVLQERDFPIKINFWLLPVQQVQPWSLRGKAILSRKLPRHLLKGWILLFQRWWGSKRKLAPAAAKVALLLLITAVLSA